MNEPNLKYALGMPITIARFGQTGRYLGYKYALLERVDEKFRIDGIDQRSEKPLVISKEFHVMARLDDMDLIAVGIQQEGET